MTLFVGSIMRSSRSCPGPCPGPWSLRLLLAVLLAWTAASASTVVPLSVAELAGRSQQIFHGVCVAAEASMTNGEVSTHLRFVVAEHLKGVAPADTLSISLPGGELDGIRYQISGMPSFRPGQEVVLFLTDTDNAGRVWPVGLAQGGFHVRRSAGKEPRVRRDHSELRFEGSARVAGIVSEDLPLEQLLDQVRALTGVPGDPR
jgi:hypothetical protein